MPIYGLLLTQLNTHSGHGRAIKPISSTWHTIKVLFLLPQRGDSRNNDGDRDECQHRLAGAVLVAVVGRDPAPPNDMDTCQHRLAGVVLVAVVGRDAAPLTE